MLTTREYWLKIKSKVGPSPQPAEDIAQKAGIPVLVTSAALKFAASKGFVKVDWRQHPNRASRIQVLYSLKEQQP